jgi:hypothetical protein
MARRALVVWIDAEAKHCGRCRHCRLRMRITGWYPWCALTREFLQFTEKDAIRHPECLRAETFAGG